MKKRSLYLKPQKFNILQNKVDFLYPSSSTVSPQNSFTPPVSIVSHELGLTSFSTAQRPQVTPISQVNTLYLKYPVNALILKSLFQYRSIPHVKSSIHSVSEPVLDQCPTISLLDIDKGQSQKVKITIKD